MLPSHLLRNHQYLLYTNGARREGVAAWEGAVKLNGWEGAGRNSAEGRGECACSVSSPSVQLLGAVQQDRGAGQR